MWCPETFFGAVFALDATTGALVWNGALSNDYPSPAVANGNVYAGDVYGFLSAFDASSCGNPILPCNPLWMGEPVGSGGRMNSSPAVANALVNGNQNPVVYVGSEDGYLYAFDANGVINCTTGNGTHTCQPLWVGATHGYVQSSPAVANGVVYVGSGDGNLYAFDAAGIIGCSGRPTVCNPLSGFYTNDNGSVHGNSSPAVSGGWVYVGSSDGYLYALQPAPPSVCNHFGSVC